MGQSAYYEKQGGGCRSLRRAIGLARLGGSLYSRRRSLSRSRAKHLLRLVLVLRQFYRLSR